MSRQFLNTLLCIAYFFVKGLIPTLFAQSNTLGIPFQAIAKDRFNNPVRNHSIYVESNLLYVRDSQVVFSEEFSVQTDEWGLFQIIIGSGKYKGGVENELIKIPFAKMNLLLQLKISILPSPSIQGWNYTDHWIDMGAAPFGLVPYAIYALQSNSGITIKSKGRSVPLQSVDSLVIPLNEPFDLDDGISISLESELFPLATPSYYIQRDVVKNRLLIFFTAPYSGFLSWMIID